MFSADALVRILPEVIPNSFLYYSNIVNILHSLIGKLIFELSQVFLALYFHLFNPYPANVEDMVRS
jgi:hypothetical protein